MFNALWKRGIMTMLMGCLFVATGCAADASPDESTQSSSAAIDGPASGGPDPCYCEEEFSCSIGGGAGSACGTNKGAAKTDCMDHGGPNFGPCTGTCTYLGRFCGP